MNLYDEYLAIIQKIVARRDHDAQQARDRDDRLADAQERAQQRAESSLAGLAQLNQAVSDEVYAAREALRPTGNEGLIADPPPATTAPGTEVEPEQAVQAVRDAVADLKATVLAQRIAPTRPAVAHAAVAPPRVTPTVTPSPTTGPPRIRTQTAIMIGIVFAVVLACTIVVSVTRLIDRLTNQPRDVATNNAQVNQHETTTTQTTATTTERTTSARPSPSRPVSTPVRRRPVTGTIVSHNDTKLRNLPTLDEDPSTIIRTIPVGATVTVYCQVTGPVVHQDNGYDNDLWDWIEYDGSTGYIADALVHTGATTSTQVDRC